MLADPKLCTGYQKQITSSMQIIANLSNVLSITLPTVFADFIDLIASWFRFDILELFSLGLSLIHI